MHEININIAVLLSLMSCKTYKTNALSYCLGKTTIKSTQFRSKAGALAFIKQHITSEYDGSTVTLKNMQNQSAALS